MLRGKVAPIFFKQIYKQKVATYPRVYTDAKIRVRCIVYYSLMHFHLNYDIAVYGSANKTVLKKLQIIQNSIMKIITFTSFRQSAKLLFKHLKKLNVESMSKVELAKITYGCDNGQIPIRVKQLFTKTSKVRQFNIKQKINDAFFQTKNLFAKNHIPSKIKKFFLSSFKKEYSFILLKDKSIISIILN